MLKPDSVNLVKPPNTTIPNTLAALPSSQYATDLWLTSGKPVFVLVLLVLSIPIVLLNAPSGDIVDICEVDLVEYEKDRFVWLRKAPVDIFCRSFCRATWCKRQDV